MGAFLRAIGGECCCAVEQDGASFDMVDVQQTNTVFVNEVQVHDISGMEEQVAHMSLNSGGEMEPGRRAFMGAVRRDDAPAVLQFVADGAKVEVMSEALRLACNSGSLSVVRELVAVGLTVNESCLQTGFTPIHLAAAGGHHTVCEVLLDAMADVHKVAGNTTAQALARKSGHVEVDEIITRHIAALVAEESGDQGPDASAASNRRAHVLPRVSPFLSEAVLQAVPAPNGAPDSAPDVCAPSPDGGPPVTEVTVEHHRRADAAPDVCAPSKDGVPPVTDVSEETPRAESAPDVCAPSQDGLPQEAPRSARSPPAAPAEPSPLLAQGADPRGGEESTATSTPAESVEPPAAVEPSTAANSVCGNAGPACQIESAAL